MNAFGDRSSLSPAYRPVFCAEEEKLHETNLELLEFDRFEATESFNNHRKEDVRSKV